MSKYIDAEKLIAEIRRIVEEETPISKGSDYYHGVADTADKLFSFIGSLQQEQVSLPDNLDEAAEEYAYNNWEDNDYHTGASEGLPFDAIGHTEKCFKAGAEWMAGQMKQEQSEVLSGEDVMTMCNQILIDWVKEGKTKEEKEQREQAHIRFFELYDDYLQQEQPEVDIEKEINNWLDSGPYTVRETARHFYELGKKQ